VDTLPVTRGALDQPSLNIAGLAASDEHLFVSCPYDGTVKVYNAGDMSRRVVWTIGRVGPLALDAAGRLHVLGQGDVNCAPSLECFTPEGSPAGTAYRFARDAVPRALCFTPDGRCLVADDGPRQLILFLTRQDGIWSEVGALGVRGGIHSPPASRIAPQRFNRPVAVTCTPDGTIHVAHGGSTGGGSTVLEAFRENGPTLWRLFGLTFVDMADVDPANDRHVFTKEERYEMAYDRPCGAEWAYSAYTVDRFRYPEDARLHIWSAGAWVRRIAGRRFLFVQDMQAEHLQVYRFDEEAGETAIPSGLFAKRRIEGGSWPPHQPAAGEWIWRDANHNGAFDMGEYEVAPANAPPAQGWWVDDRGDVWLATHAHGIRRHVVQGLDSGGNPRWSLAAVERYPHPAALREVKRLRYQPAGDVMWLGGTDAVHRNQHWKPMGPVLARYDGWCASRGTCSPRWRRVMSYAGGARGHASCEPMAFDVAGEFVFVAYTGPSRRFGVRTGRVEVLRAADGVSVGHFELSPEIGEIGLQDIRECVRAVRRANGEYLVFIEDDMKAKVLFYRWWPGPTGEREATATD